MGASIDPMTGSEAVAAVHVHGGAHDDCHSPPLWARTLTFEGVVLRRLGLAMIAIGALLAYSPLHPGLLCPLRASTGVPCPFCGMTTSVKACVRMDFGAALAANPGGIAAIAATIALAIWRPRTITLPIAALAAAGLAMWIFQLFRFEVL